MVTRGERSGGRIIGSLGFIHPHYKMDFRDGAVVKNLPANAGDARDAGLIPETGRSPRGGNGNPLQCSSLENPLDRGAWLVGYSQSMGSQRVRHD